MHAGEPRPPATAKERESIAQLIDKVFESPETTAAHRAMTGMQGFDPASLPTVWDAEGNALSTVQAVPCEVSLLGEWLPAGIITMVATAEHARGQGYMRACMEAAHQWMLDKGRPVGILYGVPEIYPKFGYRPVMPRTAIRYALPAVKNNVRALPATDADAETMAVIFNSQEKARPCAVRRGAQPWIWRSSSGHSELHCVNTDGMVTAYLRHLNPPSSGDTLSVVEAACLPGYETTLLDSIHTLARNLGMNHLDLRLMPDHPLTLEVVRRVTSLHMDPVEQYVVPPQAGMLALVNPADVMEMLRPVIEQRLGAHGLRITDNEALDINFGTGEQQHLCVENASDLSHVLAGYPGVSALYQWGRVQGDRATIELAAELFPTSWPRWVLAPFWDE